MNQIQCSGVIGSGQMGSGIAQVLACFGNGPVYLHDISMSQLDRAKAGIEKSLSKLVEKQHITQAVADLAQERLKYSIDLDKLADTDLVVEAIVENEAAKIHLFQSLDTLLKPEAVLASNTSSISITRLAAATSRPANVIGMHFMNPVPLMALLEIIRGAQTSDQTYSLVRHLGEQLNKTPVLSHDYPGFISNRVLMPMINEAIFALFENVASAEDIDTVMKLGMNHPMGPLQLADFIGLDTCLSILNVLYDGFKDSKYRPCPLLVQKVNAGHLGKIRPRILFLPMIKWTLGSTALFIFLLAIFSVFRADWLEKPMTAQDEPGNVNLLMTEVTSNADLPKISETCKVINIFDGDTFACDFNQNNKMDSEAEKIRMLGIDATEMIYSRKNHTGKNQPYAKEALDLLSQKMLNRTVYLEYDTTRLDKYNRRLAYVYESPTSAESLNALLLNQGLAKLVFLSPNRKREPQYARYEQSARQRHANIWSQPESL